MTQIRLSAFVFVCACLVALPAAAQEARRAGGGAPLSYDVAAERTVTAIAGDSRVMEGGRAMRVLTVTVEGRALQLILAPDDFLKAQGFSVAAGTPVTVIGMPGARVDSQPAMLVRELRAGDKTYTLRDKTGKATWQP